MSGKRNLWKVPVSRGCRTHSGTDYGIPLNFPAVIVSMCGLPFMRTRKVAPELHIFQMWGKCQHFVLFRAEARVCREHVYPECQEHVCCQTTVGFRAKMQADFPACNACLPRLWGKQRQLLGPGHRTGIRAREVIFFTTDGGGLLWFSWRKFAVKYRDYYVFGMRLLYDCLTKTNVRVNGPCKSCIPGRGSRAWAPSDPAYIDHLLPPATCHTLEAKHWYTWPPWRNPADRHIRTEWLGVWRKNNQNVLITLMTS